MQRDNKSSELDALNLLNLSKEESLLLNKLFSYISNNLPENNNNITPSSFIKTLPHFIKDISLLTLENMRVLADIFFSEKGKEMYWLMLGDKADNENTLLAKLMFGKTIAKPNANTFYLHEINTPKRKAESDFPAIQHALWKSRMYEHVGGYHRWSEPDDMKISLSFAQSYLDNPDLDFNQYVYIPIVNTYNGSLENIINDHLDMHKNDIEIIINENATIGLMQIPFYNKKIITDKLKYLGIVASPWEISSYLAANKNMEAKINDMQNNFSSVERLTASDKKLISDVLQLAPSTLQDLKENILMTQLSRIALGNDRPVKHLACCLHRLISGLEQEWISNNESIKRIYLFLSFAILFHGWHYDRFSFALHAITHEISLILHDAQKNNMNIIKYVNFKQTIDQNIAATFSLDENNTKKLNTIAALANSGCHATIMAIELVKKLHPNKGINIASYGPLYYEFDNFKFMEVSDTTNFICDAYLVTAGPISYSLGVDVNLFIDRLLNIGLEYCATPVFLIVDTTTALNKNLSLNDTSKRLLNEGKIAIICHQSLQKFGLAHTDQAQSGLIYGIISKNITNPATEQILIEFNNNAAKDLRNHPDMAIVSFMQESMGHYLEKIKHIHFRNGALINRLFASQEDYSSKENLSSLNNLDETLFTIVNINENAGLFNAVRTNLDFRQSLGHYNLTYSDCIVNKSARLSPGASDSIDTLIQIAQLSLSSDFTRDKLFDLLKKCLVLRKNENVNFHMTYEIFYLGLLLSLKNTCNFAPQADQEQMELLLNAINDLMNPDRKPLFERKSIKTLLTFLHKPSFFKFSLTSFCEYLDSLADENKKVNAINKYLSILEDLILSGNALKKVISSAPSKLKYELAIRYSHKIKDDKEWNIVAEFLAEDQKNIFLQKAIQPISSQSQPAIISSPIITNTCILEKNIPKSPVQRRIDLSVESIKLAIQDYAKERNKHLGFFSSKVDYTRGEHRANTYLFLLSGENLTLLEQLTLFYAVLASKNGKKLQNYVYRKIGYNNLQQAQLHLQKEIRKQLRLIYPEKNAFNQALDKLNDNVISKIIKFANSDKMITEKKATELMHGFLSIVNEVTYKNNLAQ